MGRVDFVVRTNQHRARASEFAPALRSMGRRSRSVHHRARRQFPWTCAAGAKSRLQCNRRTCGLLRSLSSQAVVPCRTPRPRVIQSLRETPERIVAGSSIRDIKSWTKSLNRPALRRETRGLSLGPGSGPPIVCPPVCPRSNKSSEGGEQPLVSCLPLRHSISDAL